MHVFLEFFKKSFKESFAYRTNFYLSMFGSLLFVFILMSVWEALYAFNEQVNGITLDDMISFVVITFLARSLVRSNIADLIGKKVEDGSVSIDFLKPINFKQYLFANDLGSALFRFLFESLPVGIVAVLIWGLHFPDQAVVTLLFLLALMNGLVLIYHINYVLGLTTFWFKTSFYISWIQGSFWLLFSGTSVPLWFYPDWLVNLTPYLPFRYIIFDPIQIYLGKITINDAYYVIVLQLIWIIGLFIVEKVMWKKVQEKVVIHGG